VSLRGGRCGDQLVGDFAGCLPASDQRDHFLRCRVKPSGSPVELTTEAGKVVVIEIGGVQPIKDVLQFALRPLVAFARSNIAIGGRRRDSRVVSDADNASSGSSIKS
jgi:hypothetical protein